MAYPPPEIRTERLRLRRPDPSDAAPLFALMSDPEVARYDLYAPHQTPADTERTLAKMRDRWEASSGFRDWIAEADGHIVGTFGSDHTRHGAMVGFSLGRAWWGRGYATEALSAIVSAALAEPDIWRVWATCDAANARSWAVMERCGMTREGTLRRWLVVPAFGPAPRDAFVYAKVR